MMVLASPAPPNDFVGLFRTDERARAAYAEGAGIYRIVPEAVALPETVDDLQALVRWATNTGTSLIPRGAGSAVSGSNIGEGVIVDLGRIEPRFLEIDAKLRQARTSPDVTFESLTAAARIHGLRLPPDPASGAFATLGGMVATNAAGARSVRFGPVRPWVRSLDIVTGDGDQCRLERGMPLDLARREAAALERFAREVDPAIRGAADLIRRRFPKTTKNTSGLALDAYLETGDVIDLFIGSEGILGFITGIEWALDPIPPVVASLRIALADLESLGDVIPALRALDPSAIELLDRTFLEVLPEDQRPAGDAVLLVEFEGDDTKAIRGRVGDAVRAVAPWALDVETGLSDEESAELLRIRHAASPILARLPGSRRSLQVIEDGCVPIGRLAAYLHFLRKAAADREIPVVIFGHAGDGHLHVNLLPDVGREGWDEAVASLLTDVTDEVLRLGGTPAGEHGDGRLRAGLIERLYGTEIVKLFRMVKAAFDPSGIFNPGVVLPERWAPLDRLKTGARRAELPADIESGLRNVERSAGYGRSRLTLADGN